MTARDAKALEAQDKQEVEGTLERTRPGMTFTPAVDIFETENDITLIADMPGVKPENLDIDLREDVLTMTGEPAYPGKEDETPILEEYRTGRYVRRFTLSDVIDQSKIAAQVSDGVLTLVLPKAEKAVPRKVAVKAG